MSATDPADFPCNDSGIARGDRAAVPVVFTGRRLDVGVRNECPTALAAPRAAPDATRAFGMRVAAQRA